MPDYPGRFSHVTHSWVEAGSFFHIRIRARHNSLVSLTSEHIGRDLLDSVNFYHELGRWHCHLFLLMPDHVHALLAFPRDKRMSNEISAWKRFHVCQRDIQWQENFFDHRFRSDKEMEEKAAYIRRNPIAKGLCAKTEDWPWVID